MLFYIHIPFCDSKCYYCAFNSYTNISHLKDEYIQALLKQIDFEIQRYNISKSNPIETIFVGGGTPSTIAPKYYDMILDKLREYMADDIECSIEANPNSATKSWLEDMQKVGINRVSFGVQSFCDDKLTKLGRNHTSKIAKDALYEATKIYKNVSLDIIYNVAGDTFDSLKKDIDIATSYDINHISCYSLTLEENTKFYDTTMAVDDEVLSIEFIEYINTKLPQYEISNFGTYKSKHNIGYWQYKDYVGVGSGAVGFFGDKRYYPYSDVSSYIQNPLYTNIENLSQDDILLEKIFLGLRSLVGVDTTILSPKQHLNVKILLDNKKLYLQDGKIYNTNYLLADEIALFINK